ncbi:MAG: TIGR04053 family radical SAM/SPASM domain-containing protein [Gemmatimonadetes bacterium]|nr:TIGR04053 family radical SAM/SPASM domain-containing protein [Gemmatimonadota bacterium]
MHKPYGHPGAGHPGGRLDYDQAPFLVIWETTQACDLACKHCRAEAQPNRHPDELTSEEARRLLRDVRRFGPIIFVFSGGDCMKREDLVELVAYGKELGLRMAITPATTPLTSRSKLEELKAAGLARLAVSLDGSHPGIHDEFRRVAGSFEHGIRILRTSQEIGLSTQVNTVVARHNLDDFENLCSLMTELGIVFWEVFFLVPMGRAKPEDVASAAEFERVFHRLYELSKTAPFDIKATAAPQYARVVLQRKVAERRNGGRREASDVLTDGAGISLSDGIGRARSVNDGDGFMFVSHTGELFPSGFLPVSAGNLRRADLVDVYRHSPLFRTLRDKTQLKGKCAVCEYLPVCSGSRARAYATTGDYLEAEPFCAHVPVRYERMVANGEAEPVAEYFARRMTRHARTLPVHGAPSDPPAAA